MPFNGDKLAIRVLSQSSDLSGISFSSEMSESCVAPNPRRSSCIPFSGDRSRGRLCPWPVPGMLKKHDFGKARTAETSVTWSETNSSDATLPGLNFVHHPAVKVRFEFRQFLATAYTCCSGVTLTTYCIRCRKAGELKSVWGFKMSVAFPNSPASYFFQNWSAGQRCSAKPIV